MGRSLSCRYPDGTYPSVEARNNWWGRNQLSYVAGRIWERRDDDNMIRVEYEPFLTDNRTVLEGVNNFVSSTEQFWLEISFFNEFVLKLQKK